MRGLGPAHGYLRPASHGIPFVPVKPLTTHLFVRIVCRDGERMLRWGPPEAGWAAATVTLPKKLSPSRRAVCHEETLHRAWGENTAAVCGKHSAPCRQVRLTQDKENDTRRGFVRSAAAAAVVTRLGAIRCAPRATGFSGPFTLT